MYSVSEAYLAKMLDKIQTHRLVGTLDGDIEFTEADVIGVSYKNQCSAKNVCVGSVNIGVLKFTLLNDLLNRGDYYGIEVEIKDGLKIGEESGGSSIFEDVPLGKFYIAEAVRTAAGIVITAYDAMSKLDENLNIDQTAGTIYYFCKYIESETGAEFGMSEAECQALPNGTEVISPYEDNDMTTYRDLVSALAQMAGGFAYADRTGKWRIKPFNNNMVINVPKNRRISGAEFSDFITLYDAISYYDVEEQMIHYVGDNVGEVMNLDKNPFLQYGTSYAIERRALNIVDSIKSMAYTPFKASMLPAFIALDLGDVIAFPDDYTENTSSGAVMVFTWTYNKSFAVQCYGANPNLRSAQGRTDKNISGIINSTVKNEVTYYNFTNLEPVTIYPDHETRIANLAFTSAQKTTVKIMHEFIMDMIRDLGIDGKYELHYYLDGELLGYQPYESLSAIQAKTTIDEEEYQTEIEQVEMSICKDFFYVLRDVEPNVRHTWEVRILTSGIEETTIDIGHAHVTLEGQRLYGEEFSGNYIEVFDVISVYPIGNMTLVSITDEPLVSMTEPNELIRNEVEEEFPQMELGAVSLVPIQEGTGVLEPLITFEGGFPWSLENSDLWATEDGKRWVTE